MAKVRNFCIYIRYIKLGVSVKMEIKHRSRSLKCIITIVIIININLQFLIASPNERRGRVVNIPASYSGGPGLKSWPGDQLS
jgi:hypothetical protein